MSQVMGKIWCVHKRVNQGSLLIKKKSDHLKITIISDKKTNVFCYELYGKWAATIDIFSLLEFPIVNDVQENSQGNNKKSPIQLKHQ